MVIQGGSGTAKYMAKLEREGGQIWLTLMRTLDGLEQEATRESFASVDEVEKYLDENTNFRLPDFR